MGNAEIYKGSIAKLLKETDDIVFQIRSLRHKNQELTAENDKDIEELEKKLTETEATIEKTLTESKEDAIKPKCGWAHWKNMPDKYIFDDQEVINEIKQEHPEETENLIATKTTETIKKKELKKVLDDGVFFKSITKVSQDRKFEYKYTGGE